MWRERWRPMSYGWVSMTNRPPGIECSHRPWSDRSREGVVGSEEMIMLDSNQPLVLRRDPWNKGRGIGRKRPLKPSRMRKKSVYWSQIWDKIRGAWRDVGDVRCAVGMSAARCCSVM